LLARYTIGRYGSGLGGFQALTGADRVALFQRIFAIVMN
jgi:hypothetical protein